MARLIASSSTKGFLQFLRLALSEEISLYQIIGLAVVLFAVSGAQGQATSRGGTHQRCHGLMPRVAALALACRRQDQCR
ncbi:hypothetical protein E8E68_09070 [Pseudomonas sp. BN607]|nr:hypothetical protein [Pseudomonas sp. BN607]